MKLPRVRFTVRRMMGTTAVVAALLAGGILAMRMSRLAEVLRQKALGHAAREANERLTLQVLQSPTPPRTRPGAVNSEIARLANSLASRPGSKDLFADSAGLLVEVNLPPFVARPSVDVGRETERYAARIAYHARMRQKYEWAARFPWLPLDPDPPEPK
jgi:hypothetical protein